MGKETPGIHSEGEAAPCMRDLGGEQQLTDAADRKQLLEEKRALRRQSAPPALEGGRCELMADGKTRGEAGGCRSGSLARGVGSGGAAAVRDDAGHPGHFGGIVARAAQGWTRTRRPGPAPLPSFVAHPPSFPRL